MRKRLLALFTALLFVFGSLTISTEVKNVNIKDGTVNAKITYRSNNVTTATLQPIVVITQPEDGAVVTDPHLVVLGYAMDEAGMNYWEWEWHWKGGSYSNSSYFETAEYVEFRIDIYGLHEGWNLVIVRFKNIYGAMGEDSVNVTYNPPNNPPNKPSKPEGPTEGKVKTTLYYNTVTTDPDGDSLEYLIDWGDGTDTGWMGPIASGYPFETFHSWDEPGTYEVRAKARDIPYYEESEWSEPLIVTITGEENDTESPVVVKEYPPDGATFTEPNITAWGYATDNVGVVSFGYTHEWEGGGTGSSWPLEEPTANYSFEIPLTLHEGWNRIRIEAWDAAGNYGYDEETVFFVKPLPVNATMVSFAGPHILDIQLARLINMHIKNYQNMILIFTCCYAGDFVDDFAGKPNTAVLAGNQPCQCTWDGWYDLGVANALKMGKNVTDIHQAGKNNKHPGENPFWVGPNLKVGGKSSTHILIWAGNPGRGDWNEINKIKNNFAGQPGVTITVLAGNGGGADGPATLQSLVNTLKAIGQKMTENEQFILYVADHGDKDIGRRETISPQYSYTLEVPPSYHEDLERENYNQPAVSIYTSQPLDSEKILVSFNGIRLPEPVEYQLDLNGNGIMDEDEEYKYTFPLDESLIRVGENVITITHEMEPFQAGIYLESGAISQYNYSVEDTTPPTLKKTKPVNGVYVNDRKIIPFIFPIIIGSITIEVDVIDNETGVKKVDFYIDDELKATDTIEPYAWKWGGTYFGLHTIKIVAYDNAGNYGEHEEKVFIINWKGETTKIPRPLITSPIDKQAVGGMVRINVTEEENATDISYCRFSYFDGEKWIEIDTDYGYVVDAAIYRGEWFAWWDTSDLSTGYYKIRAEMENSEGYIGYDEIELYVERSPVIVVDIVEYDPKTGRTVFDASGSYDPDGEITNVYWTFWTYPNVTNMSGFRVEYVYPGNYTFSVKLVDNLGVISTGLFFDMKGTAEKKFAVEIQEIDKKTQRLKDIKKKVDEVREKNANVEELGTASSSLSWILKVNLPGLKRELEKGKNLRRARDWTEGILEWLKDPPLGVIPNLEKAKNKLGGKDKHTIENLIKELKKIYIQFVCLSAKIWIIEEIGATTHGAEIPMPKDIWIGDGGSYYRMSNQSIHIDKDHVYCHDVILHEFDHHFMYKKNYKKSLPGGEHFICQKSSKKMAWSEGWAHFSSCAKQNDPIFHDPKWTRGDWDVENGKKAGSDGKWGTADDYDCPSAANKGDEAEASIAGILWDLYDDTPNEKDAAGKKFDQVSLPFKTIVEAMNIKKTATNQGDIHDFYNRLKNVLIKEGKWNADLEKKIRDIFLNHGVTP